MIVHLGGEPISSSDSEGLVIDESESPSAAESSTAIASSRDLPAIDQPTSDPPTFKPAENDPSTIYQSTNDLPTIEPPTITQVADKPVNIKNPIQLSNPSAKPPPASAVSLGKGRLTPNLLESRRASTVQYKYRPTPPRFRINQALQRDLTGRTERPFVLPTIGIPPKRVPSPTFARFQPGFVCGNTNLAAPQNVIFQNFYGLGPFNEQSGNQPPSKPYAAPRPSDEDILRMSRSQFKRFIRDFTKSASKADVERVLQLRLQYNKALNRLTPY